MSLMFDVLRRRGRGRDGSAVCVESLDRGGVSPAVVDDDQIVELLDPGWRPVIGDGR